MKFSSFKYFIVLFISMTLFSCHGNRNYIKLKTAENLMETRPDSALLLLETIESPEELNRSEQAEFHLLMTQARDKNYKNLAEDTLIFQSVDYFAQKDNPDKLAWAYFYANRVELQRNHLESAINYILLAKKYAEEIRDHNLLGLICFDSGSLHRNQGNFQEAIQDFQSARKYFERAGNEKNAQYAQGFIGDIFLLMEPTLPDSALHYYNASLDYARQQQDTLQIAGILRSIGVAEQVKGNFDVAKNYIKASISLYNSEISSHIVLYNNFLHQNQLDSAELYLKAINLNKIPDDPRIKHSYYRLLSEIYEQNEDYQSALKHTQTAFTLLDSLNEQDRRNHLLEILAKFEKVTLQNKYNKSRVVQQRLIIIIVSILLLTSILCWIFYLTLKKKNKDTQELNKKIQGTREIMDSMTKSHEGTSIKIRTRLLEELDISRKVIYFNRIEHKTGKEMIEKFKEFFDKDLNVNMTWENLHPLIEGLHNDFSIKLRNSCPTLTEKEIQFCCLFRGNLSTDECAFVLDYTRDTANTVKYNIRKKLGFSSMKEFEEFINSL